MIPPDAASRLRLSIADQPLPTQPVQPAQKVAEALSDLVPGQRVMAQIQGLMPNGTYRALVGQRDVTLALPFSAKPGDSLELEVTQNNGKLALAVVSTRSDAKAAATAQDPSVPTQLSQTGKLIGDLLTGIGKEGSRAQPATLNGNEPLTTKMPLTAAELVPLLKEALAKSGMFYEAHQARWTEGKLPTAALLQEPQGKLSPSANDRQAAQAPGTSSNAAAQESAAKPGALNLAQEAAALPRTVSPLNPQLVPLVQQQLDALATQTYVWQGQAWPGQPIHWEISEEGSDRQSDQDDVAERWQTRMVLKLPNLGGVEANIRLRSGQSVDIRLTTEDANSRNQLVMASGQLNQQLDAAGLSLTSCQIDHVENPT